MRSFLEQSLVTRSNGDGWQQDVVQSHRLEEKVQYFYVLMNPNICPAAVRRRRLENHWTGPVNAATAKLGLNINLAASCFLPKDYVIHSSGPIYFSNILFIWTLFFLFTWLFLIFLRNYLNPAPINCSGDANDFRTARVWEKSTFFLLSDVPLCEGGTQLRGAEWKQKARKDKSAGANAAFQFYFLFHSYIFRFFCFCQLILSAFLFVFFLNAWMLKPVSPASSWTGHIREDLSPCLLGSSERSSWAKPPEKTSERFWIHTAPLCYRPAHGYIDSAGLWSVEECAVLHTS